MSLFHYQEWFDAFYKDGITVAVGDLFDYREQIIIGTLQGVLAILDPGRDADNRQEASSLLEQQLHHPIIQILVGRFLSSYDGDVLAVLHPKELTFYRVVRDNEETCRIESMFTHRIKGQPAYNMCEEYFGKSERQRICVQTINCTLHFFESENHLLSREAFQQIHPGPIAYNAVSESMLTTCGGILQSTKFVALTSAPSRGGKSIAEWEMNLGDTPVGLKCVSTLPVQPSIMVLCRRSLHCFTSGGAVRFSIRLENPAMAMYVQTKGAMISTILATHVRTLLFYQDTTQVWAAQLSFIPISLELATFGEGLRNMILMLSDENRLSIGYLGTEPSLFRMPVTDSRFIDFPARQKEMQEYEEMIAVNTLNTNDEAEPDVINIQVDLTVDSISNAIDSEEGVPSATLQITATGSFDSVDIFVQNSLSVFQIGTEPVVESAALPRKKVYLYNMFAENAVFDHRMSVIVLADNRDTCYHHCFVPLKLICEHAASQKSAMHKFTLDSTENCLDIQQLFPEFESENATMIGFRPFYSKDVVSVFVSQKANRYRIQSDSPSFCYVIITEIMNKVKKLQPNAKMRTNSVPMQLFLRPIGEYLEAERQREREEEDVRRLSIQMRHVEMVLLQKLKNEHEPPASHINVLVNYTYKNLLIAFDQLQISDEKTSTKGQRILRSLTNLFHLMLKLADVELPFDGRILDGTFQKLADRICILLPNALVSMTSSPEPADVIRMLVNYCESGGKLGGIHEVDEEEEEAAAAALAAREQEEEQDNEFIELKSGTVPVKLDAED